MGYEQPRVPLMREGENLFMYIKELVRMLRATLQAAWNSDRLKDEEIKAIKERLDKLEGGN